MVGPEFAVMTDEPDESNDSEADPGLDTADAFSLLGNATRLEIVSLLHDESVESPAAFSSLYERADLTDSAQFNYHLKQLVPHFVSKSDDGYRLTAAGRRLARAVAAGTYTDVPHLDPFEIGGACYACGEAALRASYEDERLTIECGDCGETVLEVRVPPTVVRGRDPDDIADAFDRWSRMQGEQAHRGVCPNCGGAVEPSVTEQTGDTIRLDAVAVFDCTVCGLTAMTSFGGIAYQNPAVEAFHRRRGESLRDRPYWEIGQYVAGDHTEIVSRDPWLVRVSFFVDGDACHVDIDGNLEVVKTEIVPDESP